jgi:hypothetical protein
MTAMTTQNNNSTTSKPIRRVDLVHHETLDSNDKNDPYKYGEGVEARPYRYGFASVERAIDQQKRRDHRIMEEKMLIVKKEMLEEEEAAKAPVITDGNDNEIRQKKKSCMSRIKDFLNPTTHPGPSDEMYNSRHKRDDIIAPNGGASGVAPDKAYQH